MMNEKTTRGNENITGEKIFDLKRCSAMIPEIELGNDIYIINLSDHDVHFDTSNGMIDIPCDKEYNHTIENTKEYLERMGEDIMELAKSVHPASGYLFIIDEETNNIKFKFPGIMGPERVIEKLVNLIENINNIVDDGELMEYVLEDRDKLFHKM